MTIQEIIRELERLAPPSLQESYDNSGLMVGEAYLECTGALISLDITESIIEEAERLGCNLIVAHHPIWFQARKRLNGEDYVSRSILLAIRKGIALYSIHTNLDNVFQGVNLVIAQRLGLRQIKILDPKPGLMLKLEVFVPETHVEAVLESLFQAGGGNFGEYDECSFRVSGKGSFRPSNQANPFIGKAGIREEVSEAKIELVFPAFKKNAIIQAMLGAHPYEEVAFQVLKTENLIQEYGSGMIGVLEQTMTKGEFLARVKEEFYTGNIRYADKEEEGIRRVAVCGGAGSFLIPNALKAGADAFITGDISYHKFFDGEGKMMILDIGHYESEQFTPKLIHEELSKKFTNFALHLSKIRTNPVQYY